MDDDGIDGEKETSKDRARDETHQYGVFSQMYNMTILFDTYALGSRPQLPLNTVGENRSDIFAWIVSPSTA